MSIAKFSKQPADVQDYDVDFTDYLASFGDAGQGETTVADPGLTLVGHSLLGSVVKVWLAGGTDGSTYKITTTLTTTGGRVKQAEFLLKVKDL